MCNKAVSTYHSAIQIFPECHKPQEMCDKAVDTCPFVFYSVPDLPDQYMKQEIM